MARGEYYSGCWTRAIRTHLRRLSALLLGRKWEEERKKEEPRRIYIHTHSRQVGWKHPCKEPRERAASNGHRRVYSPLLYALRWALIVSERPWRGLASSEITLFLFLSLSLSFRFFQTFQAKTQFFFFSVENFSICCFLFFPKVSLDASSVTPIGSPTRKTELISTENRYVISSSAN